MDSKPPAVQDILVTALGPVHWGTTYVVTTQFLPPDRPLLAGLLRALPVGLLMLAAYRRLPAGAWWGRAFVLGALNIGFFFPLFFIGVYRLPGGVAGTTSALQPLLVALCAWPLLHERPARARWARRCSASPASPCLCSGRAPGWIRWASGGRSAPRG